ncbi:hypothetical protein [Nannocystis radixulma]|uniref:Uncharacterized protein n=1 Tax=Nannocystis radixulma TaxID=2995305 RepID=A0ABT5B507_9BACT|nr:hypothetical protein [Nannocystis radixulma]MDC0669182.1 hypothetical protein [Nannocystis radixulma]
MPRSPAPRPHTTLKSRVHSHALLGLLPDAAGETLVAVHAFEPHHRGGDVMHYWQDERTWQCRTVRDGDDYHGEVVGVARAVDGSSFALVYWDEQRLWLERFGPAGELVLRAPLLWPAGDEDIPEQVALAVDAASLRVVVALTTARAGRTARTRQRRRVPLTRLVEATLAGTRELPLDLAVSAMAFVADALVIFGEAGDVLVRPAVGPDIRVRHDRLTAPRIFATRGRELLLGTADALALVRLDGPTPAITWSPLPFTPQHACFTANGWAAVRARERLIDVVDAAGRAVARQLPRPATSVALAAGGTLLIEGDAGELRMWTRDEFRALPAVDASAVIGSLVAAERPTVPAILAELAPPGDGELAAELEQLLAAARKHKRDWWFLDLARDVAERRGAVALTRGDTADAAADLLFAASVHRDAREARQRSAVRKRADAVAAALRATQRPLTRDLPAEHLFDLLERTRERTLVVAFARAILEQPGLASPTFHLAWGVVATMEWLGQLGRLAENPAAKQLESARELAAAARGSLERSLELLPTAALPRLWLANLHRASDMKPWTDRPRARALEQAVRRCTELGPARVAAFLDAQADDGLATWHLEANDWRVGLPTRLRAAR